VRSAVAFEYIGGEEREERWVGVEERRGIMWWGGGAITGYLEA